MIYIIDENKKEPAYLQLYKMIREDIVKGIYPYETKLPSKRNLASETGLSVITIEHAYDLLSDEGYIEARLRSGYYVIFSTEDGFSDALGLISQPQHQTTSGKYQFLTPHKESTLDITDTQFPFNILAKTMRQVISSLGENILERSPNVGCYQLRDAISRYLSRSRGINVSPEQIIIGSGSEYLYGLIVELLGQNKIYGIEYPSYKKIEEVYSAFGVAIEKLPLRNDGIESSALHKSKADILHISPYRSYPTGVSATASKRHEYIKWAGKTVRYIIEDDFESEFSTSKKPEETLFSHATKENVIYMNTFSKTISPSLRVGYMVLPKHLVSQFEKQLGFYSCTVPTYIQYVLTELINNGDFERHIIRVRRKKRQTTKAKTYR